MLLELTKRFYLASVFLLSGICIGFPITGNAQSYSTIDADLALYCADLPDGTNAVTRVISNNGLHTVTPVDAAAESAAIGKIIKDLQKRIAQLKSIKKDYDPSSDISKLKKLYKFVGEEIVEVTDGKADKTKASQIHKKISLLISQIEGRRLELVEAQQMIQRCINNENLIPPPQAVSAQVLIFNFNHPDYGTPQVMRGLGITGALHKKAEYGIVCVGVSKVHSNLAKFPAESTVILRRNPCLSFFQTSFRRYPICNYGAPNTGVGWFSYSEPGFSQSAVSERELATLESRLAFYSPIHVRVPTKKKPCRTRTVK